ncbi:putative ubiquitin conjugation factor E4 A isoform X2 [Apostichopus japonicus]|uniref:Ubiquitin conjugation factor E4 A n=1 Tax=Stichopus japonicus TaxID=307972 RepID=A0A2G8L8K8_STIJA|nr:putative ubiquitin conjugation factor E4 A isoform X2 [Apostichopus japonicus]
MATSNPFAHLVKNQPASDEPSSKQEKDVLEEEGATIPVHLPEKVGQHEPLEGDTQITDQARIVQTIDRTIQKVFLVTVDSDGMTFDRGMPTCCVYLVDMAAMLKEKHGDNWCWFDWELVESEDEEEEVTYLKKCECIIISNTVTCLITPEVYQQQIHQQALDILIKSSTAMEFNQVAEFFQKVAETLNLDEDLSVSDAFMPILDLLKFKMNPAKASLSDPMNYAYCDILQMYASNPALAEVLLRFEQPHNPHSAKSYELSLFGYVLSLSCIPSLEKTENFFEKPSTKGPSERQTTMEYLWKLLSEWNKRMHQIFKSIFKSSTENRNRLLYWIGSCLNANKSRVKLWSRQSFDFRVKYCSNEFFLNLAAVLLRLCEPFCKPGSDAIVSVNLSYCEVPVNDATPEKGMASVGVHTRGLAEVTKLIKREGETPLERPRQPFKFVTDIYFLTQQCMNLGFHVLLEDFYTLNRQLHQLQEAYRDATATGGGATGNPLITRLHEEMEKAMSQFLAYRSALLESTFVENGLYYHIASTRLLCHSISSDGDNSKLRQPTLPLPEKAPDILTAIPELIAENAIDFLMFLRRFNEQKLEDAGDALANVMTFVILFMGNKKFMNNPHLRAKLAEVLEGLLPIREDGNRASIAIFHRERMFKEHTLDVQLSHAVLSIFVDIEFTGDEHQFEQKFNYRRPMYKIIKYLWGLEKHKNCFKILAKEALLSIEDHPAPLFLQFINLLVNDAIFMLDEAMTHLKSIREYELQKESGEFQSLPQQEQQQRERQVRTSTAVARFFNVMSRESVACLAFITEEIKDIFTHPVMVERIAAMFNDFLLKLVGKKSAELKVRDFSKLEFNPGQLVQDICQVYINLGDKDEFCRAVSQDGRSYDANLFAKAEDVLRKIVTSIEIMEELKKFSDRVKEFAQEQVREEEAFADAPEEFMDPVTCTIMNDPVTLPSSKVNVDRSVISRHLLSYSSLPNSDHTDPFNRSPLTMDQVIPNTELKKKIVDWKREQRKK